MVNVMVNDEISVKKISCQKSCMKTYVCSICIISVSFYEGLHMRSKANVTFSDVSVWMRNFWKMLDKANFDGERFKTKTQFSNVSGLM